VNRRLVSIAALFLALDGRAYGQELPSSQSGTPSDRRAETSPVQWVRITADEANLHSRPDANSVPVVRVPRGTLLQSTGTEFGWYRLVPPPDAFDYVSAKFVARQSDGSGLVSVQSGNLRVRAGSRIVPVRPEESDVLTLLPDGARVRIVGEDGDWLRIVPPPGVFVYVAKQQAELLRDDQARSGGIEQSASPAPTAGSAAPTASSGPASRPSDEPDLSGPWGATLVAIEAAIRAEGDRPIREQTWTPLIARLEPVAGQRAEPVVAKIAEGWIVRLRARIADRDALLAAREIRKQDDRDRARYEQELEHLRRTRVRTTTAPAYDAHGRLSSGFVAAGGGARRLYKLLDPVNDRLVAYLDLTGNGKIRVSEYVERLVGVRGRRSFEPTLGADLIVVEHAELLGESTTRPARPGP
jgi:hypothetical protein